MENNIKIINEQEVLGKHFKVYGTVENPLFMAKDVAEWIDYAKTGQGYYDTSNMLKTVDEDEKVLRKIFVDGKSKEYWFLTEDGLYEVLMQSRKSIAKKFKKEVKRILKTIRKTGGYINNSDLMINTYFSQASDEHKILVKGLLENIEGQQMEIIQLQNNNKRLDTDNKALAGEILDWADRDRINAGIRKLASDTNKNIGTLWNELYKDLQYKYKIYLKSRMERDKNKKPKASCLDYVKNNEWAKILKVFCAMCQSYGKSPKDMMQLVTSKEKLSSYDVSTGADNNEDDMSWLNQL